MNYYQQMIETILNLIQKGEFIQAKALLDEELSMPYIPNDVEDQLNNYLSIVKSNLKEVGFKPLDRGAIKKALDGNVDQQALAVESLNLSNARLYIDLIEHALINPNISQETKVGLVHVIKDQHIDNIYEYILNGQSLSFNSETVVDYLSDNPVINQFNQMIDGVVINNPSFNLLLKQMVFDCCIHLFPIQIGSFNDYQVVLMRVVNQAIVISNMGDYDYLKQFENYFKNLQSKN